MRISSQSAKIVCRVMSYKNCFIKRLSGSKTEVIIETVGMRSCVIVSSPCSGCAEKSKKYDTENRVHMRMVFVIFFSIVNSSFQKLKTYSIAIDEP